MEYKLTPVTQHKNYDIHNILDDSMAVITVGGTVLQVVLHGYYANIRVNCQMCYEQCPAIRGTDDEEVQCLVPINKPLTRNNVTMSMALKCGKSPWGEKTIRRVKEKQAVSNIEE